MVDFPVPFDPYLILSVSVSKDMVVWRIHLQFWSLIVWGVGLALILTAFHRGTQMLQAISCITSGECFFLCVKYKSSLSYCQYMQKSFGKQKLWDDIIFLARCPCPYIFRESSPHLFDAPATPSSRPASPDIRCTPSFSQKAARRIPLVSSWR